MWLKRYYSCHEENNPFQIYKIKDDALIVCGFPCQKGLCQFRERVSFAWFYPQYSYDMHLGNLEVCLKYS